MSSPCCATTPLAVEYKDIRYDICWNGGCKYVWLCTAEWAGAISDGFWRVSWHQVVCTGTDENAALRQRRWTLNQFTDFCFVFVTLTTLAGSRQRTGCATLAEKDLEMTLYFTFVGKLSENRSKVGENTDGKPVYC